MPTVSSATATTSAGTDGVTSKGGRVLPTGSDMAARTADAVSQAPESRLNRIAKRAHEIYEARGGEHGKALEDWLQAERQIDADMER